MQLLSTAFVHGETIPQKYGRDFANVNPPLTILDVPLEACSLALIMTDPDLPPAAPVAVWDHWVVFNIDPSVREIPEHWQVVGVRGVGTRGELDYGGPRPPDKEHRYFFTLYALDCLLSLSEGVAKQDVLAAMNGHVLAQAELMGLFAPSTDV